MKLDNTMLTKINAVVYLLKQIEENFTPSVLASSFNLEDMVLIDLIVKNTPSISILTLDTGRLHQETYNLIEQVNNHYAVLVNIYFPDYEELEPFIKTYGINSFYSSVELRKACCFIRKVSPLKRALQDKKAWITGIRNEHSSSRQDIPISNFDNEHNLQKFNPLVEWTTTEIWNYIHHFKVPYNSLNDSGYPSIGCAPCTRAVMPGDDLRSGRWWWEDASGKKECGIHLSSKPVEYK